MLSLPSTGDAVLTSAIVPANNLLSYQATDAICFNRTIAAMLDTRGAGVRPSHVRKNSMSLSPESGTSADTHLSAVLARMGVLEDANGDPPGRDTRLEDVAFDSLSIVEFLMHLETVTGQLHDFEPVRELITLGDLCDALQGEER